MKRGLLIVLLVALSAPASSYAAFPGTNGKIAFQRGGDIWTMNPDGTAQVNLTSSAADEQNPAWSPDGNSIAFDSNATGQRHLYVMLADGSGATQVTATQPCCNYAREPSWSPDGNKLAYHRFDVGLATINIDGSDDTLIYQQTQPYGGEGLTDPEWSPDGSGIAFQGEGVSLCLYGIAKVNPDGTGYAPVTTCEDFAVNRTPSWSPDGARIAFVSDEHCGGLCGPQLLTTIDPDGSNEDTTGTDAFAPAWSPDATRIAYQQWDGSVYRIKTADPDGMSIVDLTPGEMPDWQPLNAGGTQADVLATLTESPDPVAAGGLLTYTAQAKNLVGPDDASGVTLALDLPAGVFYVSATPSQGSCSQASGTVTCNLGNLTVGSSATVTVEVEPQNPLVTLNASATAGATETDPIPANNTASTSTTVAYGAYPRPKGATPSRFSLVPAMRPCDPGAATLTHGPPLAHPSCASPALVSGHLTVGTPDANGASPNSSGFVKVTAIHETPPLDPGNGDQNDVGYEVTLTDVRNAAGLTDYTGELEVQAPLRITDRDNSYSGNAPATVTDTAIDFDVPCAATANPNTGATCAVSTTAEALLPGLLTERKRTVWELGRVRVLDGGADGDPDTGPNTLFAVQGLFIP